MTILDEVLIPAIVLVNGATVDQVDVDTVSYWHVDLDDHDVLLADGLPTESYLDMGNRSFFAENAMVDFAALPDGFEQTYEDFCRPFHDSGPIVKAVQMQLRARVRTLDWTLASAPLTNLHLIVDGRRVSPTIQDLRARFAVPAGAGDIWLVSHAARLCDLGSSAVERARCRRPSSGATLMIGFDLRVELATAPLPVGNHRLGCLIA